MNSTNHQIAFYGNLILASLATHAWAEALFYALAFVSLIMFIRSD